MVQPLSFVLKAIFIIAKKMVWSFVAQFSNATKMCVLCLQNIISDNQLIIISSVSIPSLTTTHTHTHNHNHHCNLYSNLISTFNLHIVHQTIELRVKLTGLSSIQMRWIENFWYSQISYQLNQLIGVVSKTGRFDSVGWVKQWVMLRWKSTISHIFD